MEIPKKRTVRTIMLPQDGTAVSGIVLTWGGKFVTGAQIGELDLQDGDVLVLKLKVPQVEPGEQRA